MLKVEMDQHRIGQIFGRIFKRVNKRVIDAKQASARAAFDYIMQTPVAVKRGAHHWTGYWHINQRVTINGGEPHLSPAKRARDTKDLYAAMIGPHQATELAKIQLIGRDDDVTIATAVPYADSLGGTPGLAERIYREAAIKGRAAVRQN